jgi:hypothetical protein
MNIDSIGVLKDHFEKIYGPAKRQLYELVYQYEIGECKVNIEYDAKKAISSVELEGISKNCNFDTSNIFLSGTADKLTYEDLTSGVLEWDADKSCYTSCGNAADPSYGIHVKTARVTQFIEFKASSSYSISEKASTDVATYFKDKYSGHALIGGDLGPISQEEYNKVWMESFKKVKLTSLKFGFGLGG